MSDVRNFIRLTAKNAEGKTGTVCVNFDTVTWFEQNEQGTVIVFARGEQPIHLLVTQPFDEIVGILSGGYQDDD